MFVFIHKWLKKTLATSFCALSWSAQGREDAWEVVEGGHPLLLLAQGEGLELHEDGSYGNDMRVDDEHQVNSSGAPAALQEKRRRSPVARGGGVGGGGGAKAVDNVDVAPPFLLTQSAT